MKDDAPVPKKVPTKRRQLEAALDRWLAVWWVGDLTPSERRRVHEERERRKRRAARPDRNVGLLIGPEGATPAQATAIIDAASDATHVSYYGQATRLLRAGLPPVPVLELPDAQDVVRASNVVVAAPKEPSEPAGPKAGVWAGVKFARHRGVPVRVILPSGKEL